MSATSARRTAKRTALGLIAVSVWPTGVMLNALAASGATGSITANVAPDTSSPLSLVDGAAYRKAIWMNFQNVVAGCMEDKGFNYDQAPPPPADTLGSVDPIEPSTSTGSTTFGVAKAQTYTMAKRTAIASGYAASSAKPYYYALRGVTLPSTSDKYIATLDFRAYDGISVQSLPYGSTAAETGGCEAEGRRLVSEPAIAALLEAQDRAAPILAQLTTSEPMVAAVGDWSDCMVAEGAGTFESPDEPEMYLQDKAAKLLETTTSTSPEWEALKTEEVAVATATADCMDASGVSAELSEITSNEWAEFALENHHLLMLAGGRTLAEGGKP